MANRWGNNGNSDRLYFGAPKSLQMVTAAMKLKDACSLEGKYYHIGVGSFHPPALTMKGPLLTLDQTNEDYLKTPEARLSR